MSYRRLKEKASLVFNSSPKLLKYRWFGVPVPLTVGFGITNKCNLRCKYCFAGLDNRKGMEMPTERILDYITQFAKMGTQEINLQGGEPTLHKDIDKFITHVVNMGVHCSLATNGKGLVENPELYKKCYVVCISLDGLPETNDRFRGNGAYSDAVNGMTALAEVGANFRLHAVFTDQTTEKDVEHLIDLCERFKTSINFCFPYESGNNYELTTSIFEAEEKIARIIQHISRRKREGCPIVNKQRAIDQALSWPYGLNTILIENNMTPEQFATLKNLGIPKCLWGHLSVFFNTDNRLYACPIAFDRLGFSVDIGNRTISEAFRELAEKRPCYNCGQFGDLNYAFDFSLDNLRTWLQF